MVPENIRSIEPGHVVVGPSAVALRADFGADVIKVEAPGTAEAMSGPPHLTGYADGPPMSLIGYHVPPVGGAHLSPKRNGFRQPLDFAPGGCLHLRRCPGWDAVKSALTGRKLGYNSGMLRMKSRVLPHR